MTDQPKCDLCGHPMPPGEEMFKFHGYSGPCPTPSLIKDEDENGKPNWNKMSREEAIKLLKKIRNSLIGCEDAQDTILDISDLLGVDQHVDADNEYDEDDDDDD